MPLKSILNLVEKQRGFVYEKIIKVGTDQKTELHVRIKPHGRSRPVCSGCRRKGPVYDTSRQPRRFEFVPLWGIPVFFLYRMRRVNCDCLLYTSPSPRD